MSDTVACSLSSHSAPSHHGHHDPAATTMFGFWVYIMSDCILFATLFATYAVLHTHTFGGPAAKQLFSLPLVLVETMILLTSSFTYGLGVLFSQRAKKAAVLVCLVITFLLGLAFVVIEVTEFAHLAAEGNSWQRSAFLSSFFTLVGTHGLHVSVGLIWMLAVFVQVCRFGLTPFTHLKLTTFGLFWHFLDIVWIFVFTVVYMVGGMV